MRLDVDHVGVSCLERMAEDVKLEAEDVLQVVERRCSWYDKQEISGGSSFPYPVRRQSVSSHVIPKTCILETGGCLPDGQARK